MIPNIWQYVSALLGTALLGLGILYISAVGDINSLVKDVADQESLIAKQKTKTKELNTAITLQKTAEKTNSETIQMLIEEMEKLVSLDKSKNKLHKDEIQKYKKIIEALESEAVITGELEIEDCKIKIQEIQDESDYIGNTISNIGS